MGKGLDSSSGNQSYLISSGNSGYCKDVDLFLMIFEFMTIYMQPCVAENRF